MSQIKLKHSGGNGVIIAAPSSNPASDRTITLPSDADGTLARTLDISFSSYAVLAKIHAAGEGAFGSFTSGAFRTRDLDTVVTDPDSIVTLSSNQFTLQAGNYLIIFSQTAYQVNRLASRLRNITDSSSVGQGNAAFYSSSMFFTTGMARVSISSAKVFEVQGQVQTTKSDNGFGFSMGGLVSGDSESVRVEIYKEV